MVAWHAAMFGRYFSIHSGVISFSPSRPHVAMSMARPSGEDSLLAPAMSFRSVAPMSEANSIPMRSGGTLPFASPAFCTASWAPTRPSSTVRAIDFSSLR